MGLSSDLISQFVKVTKDDKKTKKETITYGTIEKDENGKKYIKLDGSDIRTPLSSVNSSVDVDQGDRVTVMIKNHTTTITGNLTNPSATYIINSESNESEKVIDKIVNLEAKTAKIDNLEAENAEIKELVSNKLDVETAEITYAKISDLDSATANITSLRSTFGEFKTLTINNFASVDASINDLQANKVLWSGGWYMTSGHTATLSESISSQANGIVLVFSRYSSSTAQNYNFNTIFIPKSQVVNHSGAGHSFIMTTDGTFSVMASKYLYINDTSIVGNDNNDKTGTGASGIVYTNNGFVLRYVIGV